MLLEERRERDERESASSDLPKLFRCLNVRVSTLEEDGMVFVYGRESMKTSRKDDLLLLRVSKSKKETKTSLSLLSMTSSCMSMPSSSSPSYPKIPKKADRWFRHSFSRWRMQCTSCCRSNGKRRRKRTSIIAIGYCCSTCQEKEKRSSAGASSYSFSSSVVLLLCPTTHQFQFAIHAELMHRAHTFLVKSVFVSAHEDINRCTHVLVLPWLINSQQQVVLAERAVV